MEAADQHNEIELNFIDQGNMTFRHGPHVSTIGRGQALLYWAAIPHQVTAVAPGTKILWLVLPLPWFLAWTLPPVFSSSLLRGEMKPLPNRIGSVELGHLLGRWADDFASNQKEMREILRLEMEAFFHRLALSGKPPSVDAFTSKKHDATRVGKMVRFITERAMDPISVPQIAQAAGLNPEYAMRLFRRNWGMTLWDFLLQQRIFRAKQLLLLGGAKVSDIALECGFGSASRFYSAFAKYCGCSPLTFRRQSAGFEAGRIQ